jgi:phosphatidylinositol kinase/protein kinase (PI-3  family)
MSIYQIVKLDQESLLIEFIDNTTMLKSLINREWIKCGQNLDTKNIRQDDIPNKFEKWTSSDNLNLPNYFVDAFTDPQTFYQNKLNFIKTTAIWSITGYLIGLGDRHCQNILVKENSEVIHIDYGMILGRGKILPVPEIVQFRLTPNIAQGLDIFQGKTLFYYYCYIILNALRKEKGSIFEMLETVYKVSNKTSDVQTLLSKLDKVSFCDVQDLLESSSDKEKLKKMYIGWCPWS